MVNIPSNGEAEKSTLPPVSNATTQVVLETTEILGGPKTIAELISQGGRNRVPENLRESALSRIKKNHPGLEMQLSLKDNSTFTSFIFTNIKAINDIKALGPKFVDDLLERFKEKLLNHINENSIITHKAVWDDYKNFVVTPEVTPIIDEVLNIKMNEAVSEQIIVSKINTEIIDINDIPLIGVVGRAGKIKGEGTPRENLITSLAGVRMGLEKEYSGTEQGYLNFSEDNAHNLCIDKLTKLNEKIEVSDDKDDSKEKTIYTIADGKYSKESFSMGDSSINLFAEDGNVVSPRIIADFNEGNIPKKSELHTILSETIYASNLNSIVKEKEEAQIDGKDLAFEVSKDGGNVKYPGTLIIDNIVGEPEVVSIFDDDGFFMTSIITMVRKKQIPETMALYKKVKKILDMLVADGEFIFPEWEGKGSLSLKEYDDLIQKIESGEEIDSKILDKGYNGYYKGGLSKEGFTEKISDKKGQLFFIDIKDMGSINMRDFYRTLKRVMDPEDDFTKDDAILQSGGVMTQKFIAIIEEIENKLGADNIDFTIGGDEITLFVEGASSSKQTARVLHDTIISQRIFGRITSSAYDGSKGTEGSGILQEKLDKNTTYSKSLEKILGTIERRLVEQKRSVNMRYGFLERDIKNIFSLGNISESFAAIGFRMLTTNFNETKKTIEKRNKTLNDLYKFYIVLDPEGDHTKDTLHFTRNKKVYLVKDVFDIENGSLKPNSPFTELLEKNTLGRNQRI